MRELPPPISDLVPTGTSLDARAARGLDEYLGIRRSLDAGARDEVFWQCVQTARAAFAELPVPAEFALDVERLELGFEALEALGLTTPGEAVRDASLPRAAVAVRRSAPLPESDEDLLSVWRRGHWLFFVLTQGLIVSVRRYLEVRRSAGPDAAVGWLDLSTTLLWASGAAMRLTGSFTRSQYLERVRPTMTAGHDRALVERSLSGTVTWDHHYLVHRVWKLELVPMLAELTASELPAYERFVAAYRDGLSVGHRAVCARFGGEDMGSLVAPAVIATASLDAIEARRVVLLRRALPSAPSEG